MRSFRAAKLIVGTLLIVAVAAVLYWSDFALVKKLIGYNVPQATKLPIGPAGDILKVPEGFRVTKFAEGLINPRVIAFDPNGRMLISEPKEGKVLVLEDLDSDGTAESKRVVLENLRLPHGLAFYTDPKTKIVYLYVAETHQVARFVYDVAKGLVPSAIGKNIANLPADGRHFSRTIGFGPNYRTSQIIGGKSDVNTQVPTKLYISVGSFCDVCVETETWKRAVILESDPEGTFTAEFAGGLRNSVFFTFHPETKEIWATEMGRDNLGDELPPDEINIVKVAGEEHKYGARRYGWPFCYGDRVTDRTFKPGKVDRIDIPADCSQTEPATIELPAHSAPLGLAFVPKDGGWPKEWAGDLLVAYHGSWNRSQPRGYKIVRFDLDKNGKLLQPKNQDGADFITGFYDGKNTLGRPVDLKFGPNGALYISDDSAGMIYRVEPAN